MPVGALTIGCFIHNHLCTKIKAPYIRPIREALLQAEQQMIDDLMQQANSNFDLKDVFLKKAVKLQKRRLILSEEDTVREIFGTIDKFLTTIEVELSSRPAEHWLTGPKFTSLDAALGIFLQRLYILGVEEYFWLNNKKPYIENYFERFSQRDSFKRAIPSTIQTMRAIWGKVPSSYKYAFLVIGAASATLAGTVILNK